MNRIAAVVAGLSLAFVGTCATFATAASAGFEGACCVDGECVAEYTDEFWCSWFLEGVFFAGLECSDNPCQPIGACSVPTDDGGTCCRDSVTSTQCASQSGIFYEGSTCSTLSLPYCEPGNIDVPGDFATIADAIQWAGPGDTIVLAAGTHFANNINLAGKSITIRGATTNCGQLLTTIDGQYQERVFNLDSTSEDNSNMVIKNLVITGGTNWGGGGGMFARNTSPTIMNCTFTGNRATHEPGGAVSLVNSNAQIIDCLFDGNSAESSGAAAASAAAIYAYSGSPSIHDCMIRNNTAQARAGGIMFLNCNGAISNCVIIDNISGTYCGGGIALFESSPTIVDCLIQRNTNTNGTGGGGICVENNSLPTITGCTISDNTADVGGGIYIQVGGNWGGSIATLSNTMVCSNTPDQINGTSTNNGGNIIAEVCSLDSDLDGTLDVDDAFPNDASETTDTDGDGVGDNSDAFLDDPYESADSDGDGVGDCSDPCPNDPDDDIDGDGVCGDVDAFPNDPNESADSDGDGVGDNSDGCPDDPLKTEPGVCGCGTAETNVNGDVDCDGDYDIDDAYAAMANFDIDTDSDCEGDANADGVVDIFDLLKVLEEWDSTCP